MVNDVINNFFGGNWLCYFHTINFLLQTQSALNTFEIYAMGEIIGMRLLQSAD